VGQSYLLLRRVNAVSTRGAQTRLEEHEINHAQLMIREGGLVHAIPRLFLFFIHKSTKFSAFCRSTVTFTAGVGTRERVFRNSRPREPIDRGCVAATRSRIARCVKLALAHKPKLSFFTTSFFIPGRRTANAARNPSKDQPRTTKLLGRRTSTEPLERASTHLQSVGL